jgi:outer membrane protein insertion porin family
MNGLAMNRSLTHHPGVSWWRYLGGICGAGCSALLGTSDWALAVPEPTVGPTKSPIAYPVLERADLPEPPFSLEFDYPAKGADVSRTQDSQNSQDDEASEVPAYLQPNPRGRLRIPLRAGENITYGFGSILQEPHGLKGPARDRTTTAQNDRVGDIFVPFHVGARIADNQGILAEVTAGLAAFDLDLTYFYAPKTIPGIFAANLISQRDQNPAFEPGFSGTEVNLPSGNKPWVHRWGGGMQYAYPVTESTDLAVGLNYQRVSVRNGMFSSQVVPQDSQGNPLTVSPTGQDDLLTLNAAFLLNRVTGEAASLQGTRLRLGLDQSIPIGRANILYTRLTANGTQFIPLNLVRSGDYTDTLVLNLQGGITLGEVPPYAPFNLGGINTVRGYQQGALASGRNFLTATAEYQVPITTVSLLNYKLPIFGVAFFDYGTDFGSGDTVFGTPGPVRGKPGDGLGYGLGVQSFTPFGLFRLEYALNNRGGSQVQVTVGSRF